MAETENTPEKKASPPPSTAPPQNGPQHGNRGRKRFLIWFCISVLVVSIGVFIYWLFWWRFEESTQDAYVNGNMTMLTPQIPGIVTAIYADNTQMVQEGQLLVELDPTDRAIALAESQAGLAATVRSVVQLFERVDELRAGVERQRALLIEAIQDFQRRKATVSAGAVSVENYEHSIATLRSSEADLIITEYQLAESVAMVQGTTVVNHPLVNQAKDRVRQAWVDLQRCTLFSPAKGLVAQRGVQVGQQISVGMALLAVIPLDQMWVDANFRELELTNMRIGQSAAVTADLYGRGIRFRGKVVGLPGGTGSVFSVLPPQNATGNWIKIVQRLPVRIQLDPQEIESHPLRLGLSMSVRVDTHVRDGPLVPEPQEPRRLYSTKVYSDQLEGVEMIMRCTVLENIDPDFLIRNPLLTEGL
jgi:membrane fusion protein (multidrug efflux system)